jgi:TolA-binding protein
MTDDPVRLLDEGGSELLRSLLSAAREEQPRDAALENTLAAVGVAAASASAAGTAATTAAHGALGAASLGSTKAAASSTLLIVVKWLAIGAVVGAVATQTVYGVSGVFAPAARPAQSAVVVLPVTPATPNAPKVAPPIGELPDVPPPPPPVISAPVVVAQPSAAPAEAADTSTPLAAEVAALDGARQALAAGDAAHALDLLNDYDVRFPAPRMMPEALYLRLQAFTLQRDKSDSEAVARRILRVYPSSPHAARARAVLGLNN